MVPHLRHQHRTAGVVTRRLPAGLGLREKVLLGARIDDATGCWNWTRTIQPNGYGRISIDGRLVYVHRAAYEAFVGPIPDGLDIDHLCRNRRCCNPEHLEAVTRRTNLLRGDTITAAHVAGRNCGHHGCRSCRRFQAAAS